MESLIIHPTKEQEKAVIAFLESLQVPFEKINDLLPTHVIEGIEKGLKDVSEGRTISLDEFKQRRSSIR
jgi:hypothetical protein